MGEFLSKVRNPFENRRCSRSGQLRRGAWIYFCQRTDTEPAGSVFTHHGSTGNSKQSERALRKQEQRAAQGGWAPLPGSSTVVMGSAGSWTSLSQTEFLHECENSSGELKLSLSGGKNSTGWNINKRMKWLNETINVAMSGWTNTLPCLISRACLLWRRSTGSVLIELWKLSRHLQTVLLCTTTEFSRFLVCFCSFKRCHSFDWFSFSPTWSISKWSKSKEKGRWRTSTRRTHGEETCPQWHNKAVFQKHVRVTVQRFQRNDIKQSSHLTASKTTLNNMLARLAPFPPGETCWLAAGVCRKALIVLTSLHAANPLPTRSLDGEWVFFFFRPRRHPVSS